MRLEDALKATELSEEMIEAIAACGSTPLSVAAWVVEANQAQAALDAIPWDALRDPDFFDNSATIGTWVREHGPKEQQP